MTEKPQQQRLLIAERVTKWYGWQIGVRAVYFELYRARAGIDRLLNVIRGGLPRARHAR